MQWQYSSNEIAWKKFLGVLLVVIIAAIVTYLALVRHVFSPSENPTLEPATNFEKGVSQVPQGYYAFIELTGYEVYSPECERAPGPTRPSYDFTSSGELWTDKLWSSLPDFTTTLSSPIIGFFGYGDWHERLYVIETLPFTVPPSGEATVYSVDAEGIAIVEVHGETYFIRPSQAWTDSGDVKREPPAGCHITYETRLSNYGLLPRAKIRYGSPQYHK